MNILKTYHLNLFLPLIIIVASGWIRPVQSQILPGQLEYPNHHLPWYTFEGDYFQVHYQLGNSRSAQLTLAIAEEVYRPITELYRFEPDSKTNIILRDREDVSNGAAFYFDNKIEIWVPSIGTPFRGTHSWLKNVITHEFTHMVQLGASMRRSSRIPAIYLQWLGYEDVRRPDVLYGFPNSIITYPLASVSIPAWFAEGSAQYQVRSLAYDQWDSHRDMLLRTRILADEALTLDEMTHFSSKNSLERELVYNQGYDFVRYLADRFGEEVLADLTHTSAESGLNDFKKVIEQVTGIKADQLYSEWFENRKTTYLAQTKQIPEPAIETITEIGFLNFYPQIHPETGTFVYISNLDRDYSRTSLIIEQQGESEQILLDPTLTPEIFDVVQYCHFRHGSDMNISLNRVRHRPSFSPDGRSIAYTRPRLNRFGETYQDLHIYDLQSGSKNQITSGARILDPDWHPAEDSVVAVQLQDKAQNLVLIDIHDGSLTQLTSFQANETIHTPVWSADGNFIYFSLSTGEKRDIARLNRASGVIERLLSSPDTDFREPFIHPNGEEMFFSSDADGVFNIYSLNLHTAAVYRITDLSGGAFMPHVSGSSLLFSHYQWDGYKIASLADVDKIKKPVSVSDWEKYYHRPFTILDPSVGDPLTSNIEPLPFTEPDRSEPVTIELNGNESIWRPYTDTATRLNIYPVIRFDNYSKLHGQNSRLITAGEFGNLGENLLRDLKIGTYLAIRDVTERISLFGGALIGPGSVKPDHLSDLASPTRLNNLDRDLFLIVDYRGIPFIKRSWSPTISVEIYNLKRNVSDGLFIEEFPCTSCLPVERALDIRYSMWEASLYLRSKLNRWSLIELGASYSPYTVTIDRFFSEEFQQLIPSTSSVYFKGSRFSASYITDLTIPDRHADIAPRGVRSTFSYSFEPGRLLQKFTVEDGLLSPSYSQDRNHSIEFKNRIGFTISGNSRALITSRVFTYLNRPDDYFYLDYTGGMAGMQSYPYFALGGRHTYFSRASLLFPLSRNINRQYSSAMVDKIFAHLFFEAGNGWGGPLDIGNRIKTGLGSELRIAFNNYYFFPMKLFLNTTYGLNQFEVTLPSQFISSDGGSQIKYGRELLFYMGLTFDFDL